jgi:Ca-activated chloride channel family protein
MNSNGDAQFDTNAPNGEPLDASQLAEARLTAYVLDELEAEEREAIEKKLSESETARQQIGDIRRSIEMLTAALATEPTPELSAKRHQKIVDTIGNDLLRERRPASPVLPRRRTFRKYLLAASLLLCLAAGSVRLLMPHWFVSPEVAWLSPVKSPANVVTKVGEYRTQFRAAETAYPKSERRSLQSEQFEAGVQYPESRMAPSSGQEGREIRYAVGRSAKAASSEKRYEIAKPVEMKSRLRGARLVTADDVSRTIPLDGSDLLPPGGKAAPLPREQRLNREQSGELNTESYSRIYENPFLDVRQNPLSTFSIDVDTASYANLRRFLNSGSLPPKDAVRIEEMVNYFTYQYAPPNDERPFAVHAEVAGCPWQPKHRLLRIALKGREIDLENRPASNLVFLIDVSGSMDNPAKLPLLKNALHLLVDKLAENDRAAMVVYAGSSGLVLPSTSGLYKETILAALDQLQAGGSTNGGSGIQLAYQVAREKFIKGGTNRVILCTDGDFNLGVTDQGSLTRLIEEEARSGVFLSVLGFGAGNLKDSTMEQLADRGNGNYAYIDTPAEARKVLVEQLGGTLVTIAKDVKLQLELNPAQVAAYRLIGYENRLLRAEDFNDDKKDAGEIGAGHTVTAFYELVPAGGEAPAAKVDGLKYQPPAEPAAASDELLTLKLRYKEPEGDTSKLIETAVKDAGKAYPQASEDFQFAAAVAGFGLVLRDSQYKGDLTFGAVAELAQAGRGADASGYRAEMIELVKKARSLDR